MGFPLHHRFPQWNPKKPRVPPFGASFFTNGPRRLVLSIGTAITFSRSSVVSVRSGMGSANVHV
jgi:hypothetical protein